MKTDKEIIDETVRRINLASEVFKEMNIMKRDLQLTVWKMALSSIDNQLKEKADEQ